MLLNIWKIKTFLSSFFNKQISKAFEEIHWSSSTDNDTDSRDNKKFTTQEYTMYLIKGKYKYKYKYCRQRWTKGKIHPKKTESKKLINMKSLDNQTSTSSGKVNFLRCRQPSWYSTFGIFTQWNKNTNIKVPLPVSVFNSFRKLDLFLYHN